jgi:hypothetical protein
MKSLFVLVALLSLGLQTPAQTSNISYAPLTVLTNGGGVVFFCHAGEMLEVGRRYAMLAVPDPGYEFTNWTRVDVFTISEIHLDESGNPTTITSTVVSPTPDVITDPVLIFTMEPQVVILNVPGVRQITETIGWQANFVSRY